MAKKTCIWILMRGPLENAPLSIFDNFGFESCLKLIHCYSVALRNQIESRKGTQLSFVSVQITNANRWQQEKQAKRREILSETTSHPSPTGRIGIKSMLGRHLLGVIRVCPRQADTFI